MQQTIYYNHKPLILTDTITKDLEDYLHQRETLFIDELNEPAVKTMISQLQQPEVYRGVFLHSDFEALMKAFKSRYTVLQAGGGFVYTPDEHVLLMFRRGKWDMPKGKLDEGEDLLTCALREVREETGLKHIEPGPLLGITYHTYQQDDEAILKESHWYLMQSSTQQPLTPQTDEDIDSCLWVPIAQLNTYSDHMHDSVKEIVHKGIAVLTAGRRD